MSINRIAFVVLVLLPVLVCAGCDGDGRETALLVETVTHHTGNNDHLVEFVMGGATARALVTRRSNAPTGDESYEGTLDAIQAAAITATPVALGSHQTVDALLPALTQHGWTIVEDRREELSSGDVRRTIRLSRRLASERGSA
jgi:hypothetical protein